VNQSIKLLAAGLLVGLGMVFVILTLGAFAHANPDAPIPGVALLRSVEDIAAYILPAALRSSDPTSTMPMNRGFAYMGITVLLTALAAALVSDTRASTIARPGRKGA
jgi:F0F1-type ATP synthase membrane subunit c/vacuolar-type H+-ATPase subunit K